MRIINFLACLLVGGEASRVEIRTDLDIGGWSKPHGLQEMKTGGNGTDDTLCPALVPKKGEVFEFNARQYKNKPFDTMSYHFILHKVNKEIVDVSVGAAKGEKVFNNDAKAVWKINRHFGAARFFGKRMSDSLFMVTAKHGNAKYTLRRIALTIPQRWTIHRGHVYGGTPGTEGYRSYDDSRLYWIKGHKGKYDVFLNPEDCKEWGNAGEKKRKSIEHKLVASIRKDKDEVDSHDTHRVVCKEGVDCGLILSMLQTFRWEHYIGVALTLAPMMQVRSHYQMDDGRVPFDSTGKNPVLDYKKKKSDSLVELDETEEDAEDLDDYREFDEDLDDGLDDTELAKAYESSFSEFGDQELDQ
jgi:hypothetical protein